MKTTIWLLLTNTQHARLVRCSPTRHHHCHVEDLESIQSQPPISEHESGSPIRTPSGTTFGIETSDEEKYKYFARQLQQQLPQIIIKHKIKHLIIISPAQFLGELRKTLKSDLQQKCEMLQGEFAHLPIKELAEHPALQKLMGMA